MQSIRVPVGPPAAVLAVVEVYRQTSTRCFTRTGGAPRVTDQWSKVASGSRGAILLLPGYGLPKTTLVPYEAALANQDYRSVLVDLRAHGKTTGSHVGYGKQEAQDLVQLVRVLRERGMMQYPFGTEEWLSLEVRAITKE